MVIAIFVFALVGRPAWPWLIASRILLLPVIAGLAYELIRYAGKHTDNRALMTLLAPGLWLQRLTTREPTLDQVEVSIRAIEEVRRREAAGHRIVASHIAARAVVPDADAAGLAEAAAAADAGCPFSALIRASATVTYDATLEGGS